MASVRKKCGSTMRSKGATSIIFSEQTDIEEARTYEEGRVCWVPRHARKRYYAYMDKSMIADYICPEPTQ